MLGAVCSLSAWMIHASTYEGGLGDFMANTGTNTTGQPVWPGCTSTYEGGLGDFMANTGTTMIGQPVSGLYLYQ